MLSALHQASKKCGPSAVKNQKKPRESLTKFPAISSSDFTDIKQVDGLSSRATLRWQRCTFLHNALGASINNIIDQSQLCPELSSMKVKLS